MAKTKETETKAIVDIHHFDCCSVTHLDDDGEPLFGFYYQFMSPTGVQLTPLMGPYTTAPEAEAACRTAWNNNDY